jgi:hypothetical protein
MKSVNFNSAYQKQKDYTQRKNITAYKVGASNHRSANFFGYEGLLIGGLDNSCIYGDKVAKNYPVAEAEIITKISITDCGTNYDVIDHFIGIECPNVVLPNPGGSPFICIADNCSAGDLLVFQKLHHLDFERVSVYVNSEVLTSGVISNLKYSITNIVNETFRIIKEFDLPLDSSEIFIATGGITDTFSLSANSPVEIRCE